jgi:protein-disulfide isomerase
MIKNALICSFLVSTVLAFGGSDESNTARGKSPVVVDINGTKVTLADFEHDSPTVLFQARNTFYEAEKKAIDDYVDQVLLKQQAQKEGVTVAELLDRHVNKVIAPDPDDAALRIYFEGLEINETFESARQRIVDHIREKRISVAKKAYMQSLHNQAKVAIELEAPRAPISLTDTPVRGNANAGVTLVEYADYECPYCQQAQPELDQLEAEFKGRIAFAYKDLPLPMHTHAEKAAEAAQCAGVQSKYWQFHDELLRTKELEVPQLKAAAQRLGLDTKAFDTCLDSGERAKAIQSTLSEATKLGLNGTPSFFLNGRYFSGAMKYDQLKQMVEDELKKASPTTEQRAAK